MIIQDIFLYFARFPKREGVTAMATLGASEFGEYEQLLTMLDMEQDCEWAPDIENYVYGQSLDDLEQRINKLFGSWMMVDYGEFTVLQERRGSITATQQIAVTVAMKMRQNSDMMERMIASDRTLDMTRRLLAKLYADSDDGRIDWLSRGDLQKAELVPFVASELHSYGWTLMFQAQAPDMLNTKQSLL